MQMRKPRSKPVLRTFYEVEERSPSDARAPDALEQQTALLQCPQCGGWFTDDAARTGEACPACFEGWQPCRQGDIRS